MKRPETIKALAAVTATTTSSVIFIEGANRVSFQFTRANHSAGSSAFAVAVSIDGVNFVTYNKLIDNVTNTNAQTLTRVASVSLASNTSKVYSMDLQYDYYKYMTVTVTETTDGTHSATAYIEYEH